MNYFTIRDVKAVALEQIPKSIDIIDAIYKKEEDNSTYYRINDNYEGKSSVDEYQIRLLMESIEDGEFSPMEVHLFMFFFFLENIYKQRYEAVDLHSIAEGKGHNAYIALHATELMENACAKGILKKVIISEQEHREHLVDNLKNFSNIMNDYERDLCTSTALTATHL